MIFGIGNEYQDIYADLYKLKSDFSGWLHEEKIKLGDLGLGNKPKIGVYSCINWYFMGHDKIMIFRGLIAQ